MWCLLVLYSLMTIWTPSIREPSWLKLTSALCRTQFWDLTESAVISPNLRKAWMAIKKNARNRNLTGYWDTVCSKATISFCRIGAVMGKRVSFLEPKAWHPFRIFLVTKAYVGSVISHNLWMKLIAEIWLKIVLGK